MAKSNLNTQAKRKRELAKKDKRAAKDEKRAQKKADARAARGVEQATPPTTNVPPARPASTASFSSVGAAAFIRRLNKTP